MKKTLLTFVLILSFYCAFAQWTTSGTSISNTNTGNVGIGTTMPASKLQIGDVTGAVSLALNTVNGLISDSQYISINSRAFLGYDGSRQAIYVGDQGPLLASLNKVIVFDISGGERMRILQDGTVGINTINTKGYQSAVNGRALAPARTTNP